MIGVGGVECLKTLWLHALNTRGTYVWGGWGGVFKDVVVARVQHTWNICLGWVGGVGMPCTCTTSGETPDKRTKNGRKHRVLEFAEAFLRDTVLMCCKAQNDALRSVSLTLTSKGGVEQPPAGMFII